MGTSQPVKPPATGLRHDRGGGMRNSIEVLVCCVVVGLLAVLVVPVVGRWRLNSQMQMTLANGRSLYVTLHQRSLFDVATLKEMSRLQFPRSTEFSNSTEYFRDAFRSGVLGADLGVLWAPGLARPMSSRADDLVASNNAWCVLADVSESQMRESVPYLFTRNICIASLQEDATARFGCEVPFRKKGAIVVNAGGSGTILRKNDMTLAFARSGESNRVLRP